MASKSSVDIAVVVEDEWLVRMEITDALTEAGWQVLETASGEAALELLKSGTPVRLLVTDIRLPGSITGWDVAEKFREAHKDVIVIYCSGNPVDEKRKVSDSMFLSKPCRIDLLIQSLPRPADA